MNAPTSDTELQLTPEQRLAIATTKATCPFVGCAIVGGLLPVRNAVDAPLASIADLTKLGNVANGDLGIVFTMFAQGNHTALRTMGENSETMPMGLFSLDFPSSQGVHPGDSGILMGDPPRTPPFRFHPENFDRLTRRAIDQRLTRRMIGDFIAENAQRDGKTVTLGHNHAIRAAEDLFGVLEALVPAGVSAVASAKAEVDKAHRQATQRLTKLLGEDHLVASAGEFGLLFALIGRPANAGEDDGPVLNVAEVRAMFEDKQLPADWDRTPKSTRQWAGHTFAIAFHAYKHFFFT